MFSEMPGLSMMGGGGMDAVEGRMQQIEGMIRSVEARRMGNAGAIPEIPASVPASIGQNQPPVPASFEAILKLTHPPVPSQTGSTQNVSGMLAPKFAPMVQPQVPGTAAFIGSLHTDELLPAPPEAITEKSLPRELMPLQTAAMQAMQSVQNANGILPLMEDMPGLDQVAKFDAFLDKNIPAMARQTSITPAFKVAKNALLHPRSTQFQPLVAAVSQQHGIDKDLVNAVIQQESRFNPAARSHSGALGLMQLMPATARHLGVHNAADPAQNLNAGVGYLKDLMTRYNGNIPLALAAYNAGTGTVSRYGGIPPFRETQNYVKNILSLYLKSKQPLV